MDIHKNARLTPHGRERLVNMVLSGQTPQAAAIGGGVCPGTVRKWVGRFGAGGRGFMTAARDPTGYASPRRSL